MVRSNITAYKERDSVGPDRVFDNIKHTADDCEPNPIVVSF